MHTIRLEARKTLADDMADDLRRIIVAGEISADSYLPTERELGEKYQVSRVTVRRSLGKLVAEGVLKSVPYKGYRPAAAPAQPKGAAFASGASLQAARIAYVLDLVGKGEAWGRTEEMIFSAFHRRMIEDGGLALGIGAKGQNPKALFADLARQGTVGVLLDSSRPELLDAATAAKLPCVVVNATTDHPQVDVVIQDNFNGARLGTEHLLAQRHTRIGWFGTTRGNAHARERFAGYLAGLRDDRLTALADFQVEPESLADAGGLESRLIELLRRIDAPTAWLCPWLECTLTLCRAVERAGLADAKRPALVGWCNEREYREVVAPEFLGSDIPPMLMWRPADMAELALERMRARLTRTQAAPGRIDVKVWLTPSRPAAQAARYRSQA